MASAASSDPFIRFAKESDVPTILSLIYELAAYEHASSSVLATESSLRSTLSFPSSDRSGYARTLLIFPPSTTTTTTTPIPPSSEQPAAEPECAGLALYFTNYSTWRATPGIYLEDLFVRPQYRGRGYGKLLLAELAKEVKRIGGGRLDWSVLKWNEPSLRFYESLGAKRMDEWVGMRVEDEEEDGEQGALSRLAEGGKGVSWDA
ncbi:MAG: hypothetical protein Q9190_001901 [Brigantiaea leucoxantha]